MITDTLLFTAGSDLKTQQQTKSLRQYGNIAEDGKQNYFIKPVSL
jgi:hypothetical protein